MFVHSTAPNTDDIGRLRTPFPLPALPASEPDTAARPGPADESQTLEDALARRRGLRFAPALEQAYERDTGARRGKRIFFCNLLGIVDFWLHATFDLHKLPLAENALLPLRNSVTALCAGIVLWQWGRLKRLSPLEREWLTAAGAVAVAGYIAFGCSQARDILGVMLGGNVMTVFLFICLIARLRFPIAAAVTLVTLVIYPLAAWAGDPLTEAMVRNHVMLFVCMAAISLSGNYALERKERRTYLMQRLSLLRRDAMQTQADTLRQLTLRDPLTGLANRRHFEDEIDRRWRDDGLHGEATGLLQVDVDFFKRYNDCYGHPMGDVCLQAIGASLGDAARAHGGLAARIGGEEFTVLLPGLDLDSAGAVADRLCSTVRTLQIPHRDSPTAPVVTVSVGVASMRPADAGSPSALMHAADLALYRAKREGRNRTAQAAPSAAPVGGPALPTPEWRPPDRTKPDASSASARVERLSGLLATGLHTLRFPPDIEADYQERWGLQRQRFLAMLAFVGLMGACVYVYFTKDLHADVAPSLMQQTLMLCGALALPWTAVLGRQIPWRWREGMLSGTASALVVGLLLFQSRSLSPGTQSGTVALSLTLIVATLIATPPARYSPLPGVLLCGCMAVLAGLGDPADRTRWMSALYILLATSVYSVISACLLDLSNRRGYLLRRLSEAQIAALQDINAALQQLAWTDALTRLPNRRHFEAQFSACRTCCLATRRPLALLILDIDHFKAYNDHHGHLAGDACLQAMGALIASWCAAEPALSGPGMAPFAARLGGEEFGVLLPGHDATSALAAADRLCTDLREHCGPHGHSPVSDRVTASIGVASQPPSGAPDLHQLLRVADEALYRAKTAGRNRASA